MDWLAGLAVLFLDEAAIELAGVRPDEVLGANTPEEFARLVQIRGQ